MAFPSSIEIEELKKTNVGYCSDKMERDHAIYHGGEEFARIKNQMLTRRKTDETLKLRDERLSLAPYINRAGGLIDWLIAAVLKDVPRLETDEGDDYWESLNTDADGNGSDLVQVCQLALLSVLVKGRGYLGILFPESIVDPLNPGSTELRMSALDAWVVEDWQEDATGAIRMVRTHGVQTVRPSEWQQPDTERHTWTFYTPEAVYVYQAEKPIGDQWEREAAASLVLEKGHDLALVPVFPVRPAPGQWVMERIHEVAQALFNADAQTCWHLDKSAYAQPVIKSERAIEKMVASEMSALHLDPGDGFEFAAPPATVYQSLAGNAQYLKGALYEVMQSLAINAMATQTQNARQSAAAKEIDRDPLDVYLGSLALILRNSLESWIEAVKEIRGESDLEVKIVGLADYSRRSLEEIREIIEGSQEDGRGTSETGTASEGRGSEYGSEDD